MANANSLKDFWGFVRHENDLRAWLAKAVISTPLADLVLRVGSPFPHYAFVIPITILVELLVYFISYEFLTGLEVRKLRSILGWGTFVVVAGGMLYLWLFVNYVQPNDNHWHRVVVGYELRPEIKGLSKNSTPPSAKELLNTNNGEEDTIWTETSLNRMRYTVLIVWLALFASVTFVFSTFVLLRRGHDPSPVPLPVGGGVT